MTFKEKLASIEKSVKALNSIMQSISENINKKDFGYSKEQMHEHIKQCIRSGKKTYIYSLYVHIDNVSPGVGILQINNYRTKVITSICKVLNNEKDTITGLLEKTSNSEDYLIGVITPLDSKDFILSIIDEMLFDPDDISIGETLIYEDDSLQSVLLRCEYSSFLSKTEKEHHYTIMQKL